MMRIVRKLKERRIHLKEMSKMERIDYYIIVYIVIYILCGFMRMVKMGDEWDGFEVKWIFLWIFVLKWIVISVLNICVL
jgi:hypothetical protein